MRWLVEVSALGKTDTQKFWVEAESWQRALQAARSQRGEDGPMSGFSIELLEDGYRAFDPLARVRFVVKQAPKDAPLTPSPRSAAATGTASASPPSSAALTDATMPNLPAAPSSSGRAADKSSKNVPPRPRPSQPLPPRPRVGHEPVASEKPKVQTMVFASMGSTGASSPPPIGSAIPGLPLVKLLTSREENPNAALPLTYREYAFAVAPGTSDEVAVDILRGQLRYVEAHIATAKTGKLVNLAVFDVEFTGKPPKPPVATLTWKDWKGEPVIGYPRRGGNSKPPPPPSIAPASLAGHLAALPVTPDPEVPPLAQPPVGAEKQGLGVEAERQPPEPTTRVAEAPSAAAAVTPAPAPALPVSPAESTSIERGPPSQPAGNGSVGLVRTRSGRFVRGRVSGDELITALFESMHDLHFLRDALDGGQFCLALATEVLPARAALIHFFDIDKREWVLACARGKDTQLLLTTRAGKSDELLRECARTRRAVVVANASSASSDRYRPLGGARSLIVAPIMQAGRALGAIEIINPLDGMPFTEDEGNAMTYIAEQYAEYLGSRGIILDRDHIKNAAVAG